MFSTLKESAPSLVHALVLSEFGFEPNSRPKSSLRDEGCHLYNIL